MSRLTIDISDRRHQSLKALAALQGKSIKEYAIERLFPALPLEDHAWQELKSLLEQRIERGLLEEASAKSIDDIVEEELGRESRA